jgi:hypothetical protein
VIAVKLRIEMHAPSRLAAASASAAVAHDDLREKASPMCAGSAVGFLLGQPDHLRGGLHWAQLKDAERTLARRPAFP